MMLAASRQARISLGSLRGEPSSLTRIHCPSARSGVAVDPVQELLEQLAVVVHGRQAVDHGGVHPSALLAAIDDVPAVELRAAEHLLALLHGARRREDQPPFSSRKRVRRPGSIPGHS